MSFATKTLSNIIEQFNFIINVDRTSNEAHRFLKFTLQNWNKAKIKYLQLKLELRPPEINLWSRVNYVPWENLLIHSKWICKGFYDYNIYTNITSLYIFLCLMLSTLYSLNYFLSFILLVIKGIQGKKNSRNLSRFEKNLNKYIVRV